VIKLKFEDYYKKHEEKLALLLKHYTDFDDSKSMKVKKLAFFFIFYLKISELTAVENGYPSSVAYLIMLYNYLYPYLFYPISNQKSIWNRRRIFSYGLRELLQG